MEIKKRAMVHRFRKEGEPKTKPFYKKGNVSMNSTEDNRLMDVEGHLDESMDHAADHRFDEIQQMTDEATEPQDEVSSSSLVCEVLEKESEPQGSTSEHQEAQPAEVDESSDIQVVSDDAAGQSFDETPQINEEATEPQDEASSSNLVCEVLENESDLQDSTTEQQETDSTETDEPSDVQNAADVEYTDSMEGIEIDDSLLDNMQPIPASSRSVRTTDAILAVINHKNGQRIKFLTDLYQNLKLKVNDKVVISVRNQEVIIYKSLDDTGHVLSKGMHIYGKKLVDCISNEFTFDFSKVSTCHLSTVKYVQSQGKLVAIVTK